VRGGKLYLFLRIACDYFLFKKQERRGVFVLNVSCWWYD